MNVEQLMEKLKRCNAEDEVLIRDTAVSDDAMEAGSNGYLELEEVLVVEGQPYLLIETDY